MGILLMELCYVDWVFIVLLMCVEFYLIICKVGVIIGLLWCLIVVFMVMLVIGFFGESIYVYNIVEMVIMSWFMGLVFGLVYFYIFYLVMFGEVKELGQNVGLKVVKVVKILVWFVLVGWVIYLIGYIQGIIGGLFGMNVNFGLDMDVIYNIGDVINKIGFGLVIYVLVCSGDDV